MTLGLRKSLHEDDELSGWIVSDLLEQGSRAHRHEVSPPPPNALFPVGQTCRGRCRYDDYWTGSPPERKLRSQSSPCAKQHRVAGRRFWSRCIKHPHADAQAGPPSHVSVRHRWGQHDIKKGKHDQVLRIFAYVDRYTVTIASQCGGTGGTQTKTKEKPRNDSTARGSPIIRNLHLSGSESTNPLIRCVL